MQSIAYKYVEAKSRHTYTPCDYVISYHVNNTATYSRNKLKHLY